MIAETKAYFEEFEKSIWTEGIKKLEEHGIKYSDFKADLVEE